jgi:hypothetical protein
MDSNANNRHEIKDLQSHFDYLVDRRKLRRSAPEKKLTLTATKLNRTMRMSSNEIIKQIQILAKGHNETYEIAIPMENARFRTEAVDGHVPENGGT